MKHKLMLLPLTILAFVLTQAQKSIDSTVSKSVNDQKLAAVKKVNDKVGDKINQGIEKLFELPFKKKAKKDKSNGEDATAAFEPGPGKTLVMITGTDYSSLSSFAESLRANKLVKEVNKEFSNGIGTLKVSHSGTADQVLDDLLVRVNGLLDVTDTKDGVINLKQSRPSAMATR